jgi:hypothetical protein
MSNGYTNDATYKTVIWLNNDNAMYKELRGKSADEIRGFVFGIRKVAKSSRCECLDDMMIVLDAIGKLEDVVWNEVAEALK